MENHKKDYVRLAMIGVADSPGTLYNPLVLCSDDAVHMKELLSMIKSTLQERSFEHKFLSVEGNDSKPSVDNKQYSTKVDVLLVHNVCTMTETLIELVTDFYTAEKQVVLTVARRSLAGDLEDWLRSFAGGLIIDEFDLWSELDSDSV